MTPPDTMWRACCAGSASAPSPPMLAAEMAMTAGPRVALPARARDEADASHEAGHLVVGQALGWAADVVTIDGAPHVRWRAGCRPLGEIIAVAIAGRVAELWRMRWTVRPDDRSLLTDIARVRGLAGGSCDACRAARAAIVETGHGRDAAAIDRLRDLELWTIETVKSPPIWRAIRAIADRLMGTGTVEGDEAADICRDFFEPGGLSAPAPLEKL
jgi:hypothetical protein